MALLRFFGRTAAKRNRLLAVRLVLSVLLISGGPRAAAQTSPGREYQLKALFLFNFPQFVEWPPKAFAAAQAPLVIGILGDDPFGGYLDKLVVGESVNKRPLIVQRYRQAEEIKDCHVLFVSRSEAGRLEQVFASLKDRNILTVGDGDRFAERGGMIQFDTQNNKTRLRINLETAKAANLTISSKLLKPAEIVSSGKK